jgi:hypothetical protein
MKKLIFLLLIILSLSPIYTAQACDSCNFFEYSLLGNKSYFGLFYRYRGFQEYKTYQNNSIQRTVQTYPEQLSTSLLPWDNSGELMHDPGGNGLYVKKSPQDFETYQSIEARGNYTLNNKWNFTFLLPYEFNKIYYEDYLDLPNPARDTTLFVQGWGDLTVATDYIWQNYSKKSRHTIRPGIALTIPTGKSMLNSDTENRNLFDPIIQPGTGAWAGTIRLNYQWFVSNQGINAGASYQMNTEGAQVYQFGNSLNLYTIYFHQFTAGSNWIFAPNLGFYYEDSRKDQWKGIIQEVTSGSVGFAQAGLDINYTQTTLSIVYQHSVFQNLNGNQILNQSRLSVGVAQNLKL